MWSYSIDFIFFIIAFLTFIHREDGDDRHFDDYDQRFQENLNYSQDGEEYFEGF